MTYNEQAAGESSPSLVRHVATDFCDRKSDARSMSSGTVMPFRVAHL